MKSIQKQILLGNPQLNGMQSLYLRYKYIFCPSIYNCACGAKQSLVHLTQIQNMEQRGTRWMLGFLTVFHYGVMIGASIKCHCNTETCIREKSMTCNAGYACYAEMFNATATYGCIQKQSHSGLCLRKGTRHEIHKDKPYLLLCCYKERCNRIQGQHLKRLPAPNTFPHKTRQKPRNGVLIPDAFVPLGNLSAKILSLIAAGGLFTFLMIIACAVNILCYDVRTKDVHSGLHEIKSNQPDLAHSSPV